MTNTVVLSNLLFQNNISKKNTISGPWPRVIKLFLCSTQLSTKFILFINVKMQICVGILSFISMINTSERLKSRNLITFRCFSFDEQFEIVEHNIGAWSACYADRFRYLYQRTLYNHISDTIPRYYQFMCIISLYHTINMFPAL